MKYQNPIIRGFHPDPSICRVGEDYYLVTSSFEYFPGIPIFHSKDLVNWKQIGNCLQRAEEFPLLPVKDSGGVWAPTIRYHEGTFYVTSTLEGYGNFIVTATDPAGVWSAPVWVDMEGIDPSMLFEDGAMYYCTNGRIHPDCEEIVMAQIDPATGRVIGEKQAIWNGIGGGFLEAPHVYHIGDWYYVMAAEGGTNFNHMVTVGRSRNLWGPYENFAGNPILTNGHDTSKQVQCAGHGDLVEDHNGNWWMVHLATRLSRRTMTHLGRETFLTPVVWENGWPVTENNRKAQLTAEGPLWEEQLQPTDFEPDFSNAEWEPQWIFLRRPVKESYERGNGVLRLHPTTVQLADAKNATFVGIAQPDFACEIDMEYVFDPCKTGDEAGIVLMTASNFRYIFAKRRTEQGNVLVMERYAEDFYQASFCQSIPDGALRLVVTADKETYRFAYGIDGKELQEACTVSTRFLSVEIAGKCFTGTVAGCYAQAEQETEATAMIERFAVRCR